MLQELRISNFRLFDDEITVRFRPITVFIGRNNAGKSSIIKFLLMLQQSLDVDSPNLLQPEGARVHFGNFKNLQNSCTEKQQLEFELTVCGLTPGYGLRRYLDVNKFEGDKLLYATSATIPYSVDSSDERQVLEHDAKLLSNSKEILAVNNFPKKNYRLLDFSDYFQSREQDQSEEDAQRDRIEGDAQRDRIEGDAQRDIVTVLRDDIRSLKHLQAARAEPERTIEASSPPIRDVGQSGQHTLPHLRRLREEDQLAYSFILPYIQTVAGIKEIVFEEQPETDRCFAINKVTGAKAYIADFGFGVSQCLPIFVQGALMPAYTHLMIEQPEAQLHPTAQLELGGFFADLWKRRKVGSIIEIHSDNVLLRLRRLIANGTLSEKDVSVAYFTCDEENGNMPIVKNLDINENGSMEEGLPMEFFGKNVDDVLKMAVRK